jgi:hypothetical protein
MPHQSPCARVQLKRRNTDWYSIAFDVSRFLKYHELHDSMLLYDEVYSKLYQLESSALVTNELYAREHS